MRKHSKAPDSPRPERGAVVVTGTSSGIGKAIVEALSERHFNVFATVRTGADAAAVETVSANVRGVVLDVTDDGSVASAAQQVAASGLRLEGVVSNAGIALGGPLEYVRLDELRHQLEVNVVGALAVAQAFLPQLRSAQGRLIFIGSVAGRIAMPFIGPYSASKFALRALADAMRIELAHAGIRVCLIEPGSVRTPIWRKGRQTRSRLEERLGHAGAQHYGDALRALMRQTENEERVGMPPERVAQIVLRALTSRRPRAHYIVGAPARIGAILTLLPTSLHDRIMHAWVRSPKANR
ncbi:MAG: SDR family NAD(P)-dependent oxidoreductase [Candidatus Eremiobacteraeota bacterium]|nr:SDR family NAD(P)-dependent oxidoreductase [Candidatus Eremiobacteraeota bacterium]